LEYFPIAHFVHLFGGLYGVVFAWAFTGEKRRLPLRLALVALPVLCFASLFYSPWLLEWRLVKWGQG
jgi:H+/Cl- antiporter ClcA